MKVMSFNLKNDTQFTTHKMRWENRKNHVLNIIHTYKPDVIGVQELTPSIKIQLQELLPEYNFSGKGRYNSLTRFNEQTDIAYRRDKYRPIEESTFWLSKTPELPGSRLWSSIFPRICTYVKLQDIKTDKSFVVFNTHLDHLLPYTRRKELTILADILKQTKEPLILMGDFNTNLNSAAFKSFFEKINFLNDTYSQVQHLGHNTIHAGFGFIRQKTRPIDYIFTSTSFKVKTCIIITTDFNGAYPSDHYPIYCELE